MAEVDNEALEDSNKGLVVIFIIGITVVNSALILITAYRMQCRIQPKRMILISLAIGDIFLALYSLVVYARQLFERFFPGCSVFVTASVYQNYLIHFVYGVGLIVLAWELVARHRSQTSRQDNYEMIMAFVLSAIPWITGLIVILPLTMAGMDWETCAFENNSISRQKAMFVVSTCLPACVALIVSFLIMFVKLYPKEQQQPIQQGMLLTYPYTVSELQHPHQYLPQHAMASSDPNQPDIHIPHVQQIDDPSIRSSYAAHQYGQQLESPGNFSQMTQSNISLVTTPTFTDPQKEKNLLMLVSFVNFFCVFPFAVFTLSLMNGETDLSNLALVVLGSTFTWLSIFRSFITPILWFKL